MASKTLLAYVLLLLIHVFFLESATAFHWPRPLHIARHCQQKFSERSSLHSSKSALFDRRNENSSPKLSKTYSRPYSPRKGPVKEYLPPAKPKKLPEHRMKPRVERPVRGEDRISMDRLYVGQRLKGRIINVLDYGMFVDVGTMKDGLVHIKDVSSDHFVKNVNGKYTAGDDITVYVKFVVPEEKKFGLQLYPVDTELEQDAAAFRNRTTLKFEELQQGQEVLGQVVRSSNFGVYVDIGVPGITAFLHRRKMKSNRRMRHYEPVAVCPMGSIQKCYIHELDSDYKRISVTTYEPAEWDIRILPPSGGLKPTWEDDGMHIYEPGFDGGEVPSQRDPLKRVMALQKISRQTAPGNGLQERTEFDAEFDSLDEDDNEDTITHHYDHIKNSIRAKDTNMFDTHGESLSAAEIRQLAPQYANNLLIDDVDETEENNDLYSTTNNYVNSARNKKKYPSRYELTEDLTTLELFDLIRHRARPYIILSDLKKWNYIKALVHGEVLTLSALTKLFIEAGTTAGKMDMEQLDTFLEILSARLNLQEDNRDYSEFDFPDNTIQASDLSPEYRDFMDFSYNATVKKGKEEEMVQEEGESEFDLPGELASTEMFETSKGISKHDRSSITSSGSAVGKIRATGSLFKQRSLLRSKENKNSEMNIVFPVSSVDDKTLAGDISAESVSEAATTEIDAAVTAPKKRSRKSKITTLTNPDVSVTADSITESLAVESRDGSTGATTVDTAVAGHKKRGRKSKVAALTTSVTNSADVTVPADSITESVAIHSPDADIADTCGSVQSDAEVVGDKEEEEFVNLDYSESGLSTEELTQKVFESLANGKQHLTSKDLRNWDMVHVLLVEGILTEEALEEKLGEYRIRYNNRKGLSLEAFNELADEFALLYAQSLSDDGDEVYNHIETEVNSVEDESVRDNTEDVNDEQEEIVELDTIGDFQKMSHGRGFITLQELKQWPFLQENYIQLTDTELTSVLSECNIHNTEHISAVEFEVVVDALLSRLEWSEQEERKCVEGCEDSTHVH